MFLPRKLSASVDKIARATIGKDWSLYAALLDHWSEIVGAEYARTTTPVKITFPPRQKESRRANGTLVIRIPKGLAMEFSFKTGIIRERITTYFGYEAIEKILYESAYGALPQSEPTAIDPNPEALARIRSIAEEIENEELREAVESLGEAVFKLN